MICEKRAYPSAHDAREAHRKAHWRVKVYRCEDCFRYHVANGEKAVRRIDKAKRKRDRIELDE